MDFKNFLVLKDKPIPTPKANKVIQTQKKQTSAPSDGDKVSNSSKDKGIKRINASSISVRRPPNFKVHGKEYLFAPVSCFFLKESNKFRQSIIWIVTHSWFDNVILIAILANSVILALQDYSYVNPETFETVTTGSWRNTLVENSEPFFTWGFTIECILKIVAMGFIAEEGAYLRNGWNWLDFIVVCSGLLTFFDFPNVSAFRAIRVLRPLRSLTIVPGMKVLIVSLLSSIPQLLNVVALLMFVFFMFGILGIQVWSGIQHARCRLTPFPIRMPPDNQLPLTNQIGIQFLSEAIADPAYFRCNFTKNNILYAGEPIKVYSYTWNTKEDSPWFTSRKCFWPIDNEDERVCNINNGGKYYCPEGKTCGSAYDVFGNSRFEDSFAMKMADFVPGRNFGYTNFDNFLNAFVTIFQSITMEGWVDVMYQLMDGYSSGFVAIYFCLLIIFGSFFLLNLTLAVLWEQFDATQEEEAEKRRAHSRKKIRRSSTLLLRLKKQTFISVIRACCKRIYLFVTSFSSWRSMTNFFFRIAMNPFFNLFITIMIFVNTFILALDRHPLDKKEGEMLEWMNVILSLIFALEMVIKVMGLGVFEYCKEFFNVFDAFIVISGTIELIVAPPWEDGDSGGSAVSALRSFRLFRVFKLARSWVSLRKLLETIAKTLYDIANFTVVLFLFIYIFALVGMQVFANRFHFDKETGEPLRMTDPRYPSAEVPRANFDTFIWAVTTVFQVLTGENWNTVMYDGIRVGGWTGALYFIVLVVLGNFIVLNLFLAILLGNFQGAGLEDNDDEDELVRLGIKVKERKVGEVERCLMDIWSKVKKSKKCIRRKKKTHAKQILPSSSQNMALRAFGSETSNAPKKSVSRMSKWTKLRLLKKFDRRLQMCREISLKPKPKFHVVQMSGTIITIRVNVSDTGATILRIKGKIEAATNVRPQDQTLYLNDKKRRQLKDEEHPLELGLDDGVTIYMTSLYSNALGMFPADSEFRIKLATFVRSPLFDNTILALIILSSIALAVDSPLLASTSLTARILFYVDYILTIIFTGEMVLKIVAYGFVMHKGSYLRNNWNILDFVIVIISIFSLGGGSSQYKWLKSLRTFRALRPLRMISRNQGMKLVVKAMLAAMPEMVNVALICTLIFMIFAIIGVNNYKGKFNACQGPNFDALTNEQQHLVANPIPYAQLNNFQRSWGVNGNTTYTGLGVDHQSNPLTSKIICIWIGGSWGPTIPQNFDNVGLGILTLFEISTTEGWVDVMYNSVDATKVDMQPVRNYNVDGNILFYLAFMLIGCFFVMNLFVGVLLDNFDRIKSELGENGLLTEAQVEWVAALKIIGKALPLPHLPAPEAWLRRKCYILIVSHAFDEFIMGCIGVNTLIMALSFLGAPNTWTNFLQICNSIFAFIFTMEAIIKLYALRMHYFYDEVTFGGIPEEKHHEVGLVNGVRPRKRDLGRSAALQKDKLGKLERHRKDSLLQRRKSLSKINMAELSAVHNDKRHRRKMKKKNSIKEMDPCKPDKRKVYNLWNIFDITVVLGTLAGLCYGLIRGEDAQGGKGVTAIAMIIRTFRICRIIRLIKRAKSLRILFNTLLLTLPGLVNVGSLLFLFLFIYAIMGVQVFAKVKLHGLLDEHANFQNIQNAVLTLIRCSTGEAWNYLMWDLTISDDCTIDPEYDSNVCAFNNHKKGCVPINGCGSPVAFPFFVSFTLLVTFVMLNMFIGIICDGFSEISNGEQTALTLPLFEDFMMYWIKFDRHATLFIRNDQLQELLKVVKEPFGFPKEIRHNEHEMKLAIQSLGLPHYAGNYACYTDVATALAKRMLHNRNGYQIEDLTLPDQHVQLVKFLTRFSVGHTSKMRTGYTTEHVYAAKVIMDNYRVLRYREHIVAGLKAKREGRPFIGMTSPRGVST